MSKRLVATMLIGTTLTAVVVSRAEDAKAIVETPAGGHAKQPPDEAPAKNPGERVWPETRVGRMMQRLQELQNSGQCGNDEWARQMRAIIEVGLEATPELIVALDETSTDDRRMMRSIPFLLRGIGDRRAIPALIRAIPRCFGKSESDMGYRSDDVELARFLEDRSNSHHKLHRESVPGEYSYGRPILEVCGTLVQWTGEELRWQEINFMFANDSTPQQLCAKQKLYHQCAQRWANWWSEHWQDYVDDESLADVRLPEFKGDVIPAPLLDPSIPLKRMTGSGNGLLQPFYEKDAVRSFYDLDTGRQAGLPEKWAGKTRDELRAAEAEVVAWAGEEGFDLMGVEREIDGRPEFLIRTIWLDAWEVPEEFWKDRAEATAQEHIDAGRLVERDLVHHDPESGQSTAADTGIFFFITSAGNAGRIFLGVPVHDNNLQNGESSTNPNELNPRHFWKGRRMAHQILGDARPSSEPPNMDDEF